MSGSDFAPPFDLAARILNATLRWRDIPVDAQQAAIAAYGMEGFVELAVLGGFYQMFSTINQGFDIRSKEATPHL